MDNQQDNHQDNDELYGGPSKSQVKRELLAVQELGAEIIELPIDRIKKLPLSERLLTAVLDARKITAHGGRRRQMLFVGKLMRQMDDAEIAAIRKTIEAFTKTDAASIAQFHALERLRAKLIEDDAALTTLLQHHPSADVQQLRSLIRNARKEAAAGKPPASFRELFQVLKELKASKDSDA
jgi:ribosome-associated protein